MRRDGKPDQCEADEAREEEREEKELHLSQRLNVNKWVVLECADVHVRCCMEM